MSRLRTDITGVILFGGRSSRMGNDKALMKIGPVTFIEKIESELQKVFKSKIVISNRSSHRKLIELPVYKDAAKRCGPLGGILTGLIHSETVKIFVVPNDTPQIDGSAIRYLIDNQDSADVTLFSVAGSIQPLFGIYNKSCIPILRKQVETGRYSVLGFLDKISLGIIPVESVGPADIKKLLFNVNTSDEYRKLLRSCRNH